MAVAARAILKKVAYLPIDLWWKSKVRLSSIRCKLCDSATRHRRAYDRLLIECTRCGFIFANDDLPMRINMGMGKAAGTQSGYREYYLAQLLASECQLTRILLFGTGNSPALGRLLQEGYDVVGCDISKAVVRNMQQRYGTDRYLMPHEIRKAQRFDAIVAVEVFEHLIDPRREFAKFKDLLAPQGILCGTTNFYLGGPIEDEGDIGYMSLRAHQCYWGPESLGFIAQLHGLRVTLMELAFANSDVVNQQGRRLAVKNKRVFFLYGDDKHKGYFDTLKATTPVLPIDKP